MVYISKKKKKKKTTKNHKTIFPVPVGHIILRKKKKKGKSIVISTRTAITWKTIQVTALLMPRFFFFFFCLSVLLMVLLMCSKLLSLQDTNNETKVVNSKAIFSSSLFRIKMAWTFLSCGSSRVLT